MDNAPLAPNSKNAVAGSEQLQGVLIASFAMDPRPAYTAIAALYFRINLSKRTFRSKAGQIRSA
jgi:hypothetical protein